MTTIIFSGPGNNHLYVMKVYKVLFNNHTAVSAVPEKGLRHGDMGFEADNKQVHWIAVECSDEQTAMEVATLVVQKLWSHPSDKR